MNDDDQYHVQFDLSIIEDLPNSVLTNPTLSAISLGTWWDEVPVTTTRYQSTYSLANPLNPLNLILPYSICIAATTLFAGIAIWSLWRNGILAADSGFLQIMMATRGNTEMERLVLQEKLMATDNMPEELRNLKTRYGELVGEDVLGAQRKRLGFGTIEDTVSVRRGSESKGCCKERWGRSVEEYTSRFFVNSSWLLYHTYRTHIDHTRVATKRKCMHSEDGNRLKVDIHGTATSHKPATPGKDRDRRLLRRTLAGLKIFAASVHTQHC
jgi:hypothetical protein